MKINGGYMVAKVIRIDDDVERRLKELAVQHDMIFSSPNDVLRVALEVQQVEPNFEEATSEEEETFTGKKLAAKWGVDVLHALYRETGDWYHYLRRFPGAYFDRNGYVLFQTEQDYKNCVHLRFRDTVHLSEPGISAIPQYVRVEE